MSEMPAFPEEVSEQSEASFVESEQTREDMRYMQELIKRGLPVEVQNAHDTLIELGKIGYDEYIPVQIEARGHIDAAIELFKTGYEQSIAYIVEEANRIVTTYPNTLYPNYGRIIAVAAIWQKNGSAILNFRTDQDQTAN